MDETPVVSESSEIKKSRNLSKIALIVEGAAALAAITSFIWFWLLFVPIARIIFIILVIGIVAAPIAGIILGIVALCSPRRTKYDVIRSVIAIVLPIIVVTTLVVLFSANVIVIRLM